MNDDGKLRAVHLILDFESISWSFLDVGNSIRADDHRLARIDVSRAGFLALYDLPPVDHSIPQGIPFAVQPLQQVPLGEAIIGEGAASSSSLEHEIDRFKFEEEETILISEAKEGVDKHSCVQTSAQVITFIGDTLDEEEAMAPKTGPSLKELMKSKNKAPSPKDKNKPPTNPPPPPPQIPADLELKPNPDLRKKRQMDTTEEGELGPSRGNKQARRTQDHRSRRSNSVDNREEPLVAQVRHVLGHPCWR